MVGLVRNLVSAPRLALLRMGHGTIGRMKSLPRTIVAAVALAGVCVFVFAMSAMPGGESGGLSLKIAKAIARCVVVGYDSLPLAGQLLWQDRLHFLVRKAAHFTEYAVLGALAANLLRQASRDPKWASRVAVIEPAFRLVLVSWFFSVAYAASDEFHQLFVPGRAGAAGDVAIDSAGALVGILVYAFFALRTRKV